MVRYDLSKMPVCSGGMDITMSLVRERLKKQKSHYSSLVLRGILFMPLGIYAGKEILKNGIGTVSDGPGLAQFLYKGMQMLMAQGEFMRKFVPICFSGAFFVLAFIGLIMLFRGLWGRFAAHTVLGKSLLTQARNHETIEEMLVEIENDFAEEPTIDFGPLCIGNKWLLGDEAMRLGCIEGVFVIDLGKSDYALCVVDDKKNSQAIGLAERRHVYEAADYLREILPNVATGGGEQYLAFLPPDDDDDDKGIMTVGKTLKLKSNQNIQLSFIQTNGIPTSNFDKDDIQSAVETLQNGQSIGLSLIASAEIADYTKVTEVFCRKGDRGGLTAEVFYEKDDKPYKASIEMSLFEAQEFMRNFLEKNELPSLAAWKHDKLQAKN